MKILMTSTGSWGTGSFMVIKAMMKEMEKLGHEVRVLFPDRPDLAAEDTQEYYEDKRYIIWEFPLIAPPSFRMQQDVAQQDQRIVRNPQNLNEQSVRIDNFPLMLGDPNPRNPETLVLKELGEPEFNLYFESFKQKAQEVIRDFRPDVIECHHIWMMNQVISKLGHPVIACAHNSDQIGFKEDPRMQPIGKEGAKLANLIFAVSDEVRDEVKSLYGLNKSEQKKIITVTNGYDDSVYLPKRVSREAFLEKHRENIKKIPDNSFIISFVGKLSKTKGFDILLEANKLLIEQDPSSRYDFLIFGAGKISDVIDESAESASKYSQQHIHYMGHQGADVMCHANNIAAVGIFPSRSEGFPIAPLESMGCGLPVVLTRCGAPESFAVNELIDTESAQQLADSIKKICHLSPTNYQREKEKAYKKAREYSWKLIAQKRLELYRQVNLHLQN